MFVYYFLSYSLESFILILGFFRRFFLHLIVVFAIACVRDLLCICLPAMPLPVPDVPASQRLALDCRNLLDHRLGKGE